MRVWISSVSYPPSAWSDGRRETKFTAELLLGSQEQCALTEALRAAAMSGVHLEFDLIAAIKHATEQAVLKVEIAPELKAKLAAS